MVTALQKMFRRVTLYMITRRASRLTPRERPSTCTGSQQWLTKAAVADGQRAMCSCWKLRMINIRTYSLSAHRTLAEQRLEFS